MHFNIRNSKIISFIVFLVMVMGICFSSFAIAPDATVSVGQTSGRQGNKVNVDINLSKISNLTGVSGIQFALEYDNTQFTIDDGDIIVPEPIKSMSTYVADNNFNTGTIKFAIATEDSLMITNPLTLLTLGFRINSNATLGTYTLSIKDIIVCDDSSNPVDIYSSGIDGSIEVLRRISSGGSSSTPTPAPTSAPTPAPTTTPVPTGAPTATPTPTPIPKITEQNEGVEVTINGRVETIGRETVSEQGDKTIVTISVDEDKVEEKLNQEGEKASIEISIKRSADVSGGELSGKTVKNMQDKEAVLELKTQDVTYTLPAAQINIDDTVKQLGDNVDLKDVKVNVTITKPDEAKFKQVEGEAESKNYEIVVNPVEFEISVSTKDKRVNVSKFNAYVERTIAIPDGIDPSRITTGVVINADGTFTHIPTTIVQIDGKYYAKLNSLTNSTYTVIFNQKEFADVKEHWSKEDVNDMGSRLVINGVDDKTFEPNRDITRAEFAAIVIRALGLQVVAGESQFEDVKATDWFNGIVSKSLEYGIIKGYEDNTFKPNNKITRQEAMAIISRAMKYAKLNTELGENEISELLTKYSDSSEFADWAKESAAACISNEIVGGFEGKLNPKNNITRAETAAIVRRMLKKAELI